RTHRRGLAYWRQLHGGERSTGETFARRPEQGIRLRTGRNRRARPAAFSVAAEVSVSRGKTFRPGTPRRCHRAKLRRALGQDRMLVRGSRQARIADRAWTETWRYRGSIRAIHS